MKWWGWGDPERRLELPRDGGRRAARGARRRARATRASRSRSSRSRCPSRGRSPMPSAPPPARSSMDPRNASAGPPGAAIRTWSGCARDASSSAPDAVLRPAGCRRRWRPCSTPAQRPGVAVVPYGGGTSVVGGLEALADGHSAVVSLELVATCGRSSSTRSRSPRDSGPGLTGPEAEAALGALGATLGPLPAVLRGGHDRGVRRHALGRPGLERVRPLRRDRHLYRAGRARPGGSGRAQIPHTAAGPSLRELVLGSEGTLGVITEVSCRVRPAPASARLRGLDRRETSRPAGRSSGTSRSGMRRPTCSASPTRRRRGSPWSSPGRRVFASGPSTPICRCGAAGAAA